MRYYLAAAAALAIQVPAAHADTVVALVGDDILATFDSRTAKTTNLIKIDGIGRVLGVDVRPADGQLYALASDGTAAFVDPATGKATVKSKLDTLPPEGVEVTVDFNPVADRLRIIGADGTNLRADVDSGTVIEDKQLQFADADPNADQPSAVVAGAYSNSVRGAKETTLYDIDAGLGVLLRQVPPNDGILNTIGATGLDVGTIGFDIVTVGGSNTGMLVARGNLYMLDLTTGKATGGKSIAGLPSGVRDIAVLPRPAPKAVANMVMESEPMGTKPADEMTYTYIPEPAPGKMGSNRPKSMRMKARGYTRMDAPKNKYRAAYSVRKNAYSAPKPQKGGPRCD